MATSSANKYATARFLGHRKPNMYQSSPLDQRPDDDDVIRIRLRQCTEELAVLSQTVHSIKSQRRTSFVPCIWTFTFLILGASAIAYLCYPIAVVFIDEKMLAIVEARLLTYEKDRTGLRNFAHPFTGADVIQELTSPTYISPNSPVEAVAWGPEIVISPGLEAGRCWSFAGYRGHIGVSLADAIVVTNVTLEQISLDLAPQTDTAPKDMILWGFVEDDSLAEHYRSSLDSHAILNSAFPIPWSAMPVQLPVVNFVPLIFFSYDLHAKHFLQTFMVPPIFLRVPVSVRHILLDIQANWGNAQRTCLYRLRIHGFVQPTSS